MKNFSKELICQFIEQAVPFNHWLGLKMVSYEPGEVVICLPFREELIGDIRRPALHGGVLCTLIDATAGAAAITELHAMDRVSTLDLRVDFLRPGRPEPVLCRARVVRTGNRVAAVSATAYHEGEEKEPIAMGMAVFNIRRHTRTDPGPA